MDLKKSIWVFFRIEGWFLSYLLFFFSTIDKGQHLFPEKELHL